MYNFRALGHLPYINPFTRRPITNYTVRFSHVELPADRAISVLHPSTVHFPSRHPPSTPLLYPFVYSSSIDIYKVQEQPWPLRENAHLTSHPISSQSSLTSVLNVYLVCKYPDSSSMFWPSPFPPARLSYYIIFPHAHALSLSKICIYTCNSHHTWPLWSLHLIPLFSFPLSTLLPLMSKASGRWHLVSSSLQFVVTPDSKQHRDRNLWRVECKPLISFN